MKSFTDEIKLKATELGFSKVGFARAEQLTTEAELLKTWLSNAYHGEMEWMSKNLEQRIDTKKVFPEVKSIIVGSFNYYTDSRTKCGGLTDYRLDRPTMDCQRSRHI